MKKFSLIVTIMLSASLALLGVVIANHGESGYNSGDDGNKLKTLIITGAANFIQSYADFQEFLNRVELAELNGIDYNELQSILNQTLSGLEKAKTAYKEFIQLAVVTPYDRSFISTLKSFDYDRFREKNNLNESIFSRLVSLLRSGNLTGVYKDIYAKAGKISRLLRTVKSSADKDIFPGIPVLWQINQVYFDAYLYGQYAAMIFNDIK
jgi:hypothetical protein